MKFHKKTIFVNKSNPSKTKTLKKCPIAKINTGERFKQFYFFLNKGKPCNSKKHVEEYDFFQKENNQNKSPQLKLGRGKKINIY